jgi:signal transduction histidine kinase
VFGQSYQLLMRTAYIEQDLHQSVLVAAPVRQVWRYLDPDGEFFCGRQRLDGRKHVIHHALDRIVGEREIELARLDLSSNGSFTVAVRDTGPGISSADQDRIFDEFQQAEDSHTKKRGGTGLGLAIAKRIIELHGGRIWVDSRPGAGSTFSFTIPVVVERQVSPA